MFWFLRRMIVPFVAGPLLLGACAAPTEPEPPGVVKEEKAGEAQHGGTFNLTTRTPPTNVHPHADTSLGNTITNSPVYETLLKYDYAGDFRDEYKLLPWLAERWERTDDVTYLFHLRKGVKFHDGTEMTAEDVVWSLDFLRDPANKFRRRTLLQDVDRIEADGPHTVRVTSTGPIAGFVSNITERYPVIISKAAFDGGKDLEQQSVGTGPFKLQNWDRQTGATLVKNDAYWFSGRPYLDKVQLFYNFDAAASIAAFSARKTDVVKVSDKVQFDAIMAANPEARGESFPQNISDHLVMKMDRPPFDDVRVRRAVHLALDRQAMMETISFGLGSPNPPGVNGARKGGWTIPREELLTMPGYRQPKEADRAEAKRLLAEAGYPDGLKFELSFSSGHTRHPGEAQVVASQLPSAGFQPSLVPRENAVQLKAEKDGDFVMAFGNFRYEADTDWPFWLHSKQARARTGINDPQLDRLIEDQARELNEEKRKRMWIDIQRLLLDKHYLVPLITQVGFITYQPYAHGWGDNRAGQAVNQAWENTWVEVDRVPPGR